MTKEFSYKTNLYPEQVDYVDALKKYAADDSSDLFDLVFKSLYDKNELLEDPAFILNILTKLPEHKKTAFIELIPTNLLITYFDISVNSKLSHFDEKFWGEDFPKNRFFIFSLLPHLNDEQFSSLFDNYFYIEDNYENQKLIQTTLMYKLLEHKYIKSLDTIRDFSYYLYNKINYSESSEINLIKNHKTSEPHESNTFGDVAIHLCENDFSLLVAYSKYSYSSINYMVADWLINAIRENKQQAIINFIENHTNDISDHAKEQCLVTLTRQKDSLYLAKLFAKKVYNQPLKNVKLEHLKIWKDIRYLTEKNAKKILSYSKSLYDNHLTNNEVLLDELFFNEIIFPEKNYWGISKIEALIKNGIIEQDDVFSQLFQQSDIKNIDDTFANNFSFLLFSSKQEDLLNFKLDSESLFSKTNLDFVNKKFKNKTYLDLNSSQKLEITDYLLEKTWLSKFCLPQNSSSYFTKEYGDIKTNIEYLFTKKYYLSSPIFLIQEHLKLVKELNPQHIPQKYIDIYESILRPLFQETPIKIFKSLRNDRDISKQIVDLFNVLIDNNFDFRKYSTGINVLKTYFDSPAASESSPFSYGSHETADFSNLREIMIIIQKNNLTLNLENTENQQLIHEIKRNKI